MTARRISVSMTSNKLSWKNFTNLPNILTYTRIASIPLIVFWLTPPTAPKYMNLTFVLFALASITDSLDGILARRYNQVTSIGKLLDPLADKLLTSAVLIMLIPQQKVQAWVVFLIIGREIIITGLRSVAASQGVILDASRMGKNKMISQTIALHCLLLTIPAIRELLQWAGSFFLWVSVLLGYFSAGGYFLHFYRQMKLLEAAE